MSSPHLVLVAEDDPAVAQFLQLALRAMGHDVVVAADGQAAVEAAAERPPGLALVDALLPKLDGFGVLRELRKTQPQLPVVMMSGIYKKRSYQQEAVDLGAREYLFKPLSVLKLWELADRYLGDAAPGSREPEGFAGTPLSEQPLARVLASLHSDSATGLLFVRGPRGTAILFVEDGRVVFGRSNDPQTRLDRILEKRNALTTEAKRQARGLLEKAKGRVRYGDLLVEAGLLEAEALQAALAEQQRLHVTEPLTWTEGRSQFFPSDAPRQESFKLELDMAALIVWAARHLAPGPALDDWLPGSGCRLKATGDLAAQARRFSLSTGEVELLRLADGTRTVGALRAMGRLAQVDVDRLAAALSAVGLFEVLEPEGDTAQQRPTSFSSAPSAGTLAALPPARLLLGTSVSGKTGSLRFEGTGDDAEAQRTIWFEEGRIAFANSNDPSDRLGQVLLRCGFVQKGQLQQALAAAKAKPGTALGRWLVDQGALQLDDLHRALVAQVREVVAGVLRWRSGTFYFSSGPLPTREIVPLALEPLPLVLAALREAPVADLAQHLPATDACLRKTWQCFELAEQIGLTPFEDRLLNQLDQTPGIGQLLAGLGETPETVLRAVHLLLSLGLVEESPDDSAGVAGRRDADLADLDDEGFEDEDFDDTPAPSTAPAPPALASGPAPADDGFAGADESFDSEDESFDSDAGPSPAAPALGAAVTGDEQSFAGLADEAPMEGLLDEIPRGGPGDPSEQSFAGLADEPPMEGLLDEIPSGGPVTGSEQSFAGLADEPSLEGLVEGIPDAGPAEPRAASAPAEPDLDFGNLDEEPLSSASRGPDAEPAFGLCPETDGGAPSSSAASSTATAVLEAPQDDGELLFALQNFLALLSDHLATHPGAVPEHVLATLPAELRERFGM